MIIIRNDISLEKFVLLCSYNSGKVKNNKEY